MIALNNLFQNTIRALYAMNFNNLVLMLLIELVTFYLLRNYIANKVKKKWSILVWNLTLAGGLKKILLAFHLFLAIYGILVFCPLGVTQADPVPLYALYQVVMYGKTEALTLCLYNAVLMFPVGLWVGEVFKAARSSFLYKWTAIVSGIIGIYMEYSQYVLGQGRPAADDLISIVLACCAGIFFRDVYEKIKQFCKYTNQVLKNGKNKRQKAKEKAERDKVEADEKAARDAELEKIEEMAQEEKREKRRAKGAETLKKRKEEMAPYLEKVTGSAFFKKLSDLADVFVFFLLSAVQWLAEHVADKDPSDKDSDTDNLEGDFDEEEVNDEPRWKKLKRENQKQAKNPMIKKTRRMKRQALRKMKGQEAADTEPEEVDDLEETDIKQEENTDAKWGEIEDFEEFDFDDDI